MSPIFSKGYSAVEISADGGEPQRITRERVQVAGKLREKPLTAPASVEGVLLAVDLKGDPLRCRIDHPLNASVTCLIPATMRNLVAGLVDAQVRAEGDGEFDPGTERPRRLHVATLQRLNLPVDRSAWRRHQHWQELALQRGTAPFEPGERPPLFDDQDDLESFLAAAHGR